MNWQEVELPMVKAPDIYPPRIQDKDQGRGEWIDNQIDNRWMKTQMPALFYIYW